MLHCIKIMIEEEECKKGALRAWSVVSSGTTTTTTTKSNTSTSTSGSEAPETLRKAMTQEQHSNKRRKDNYQSARQW
jgi:hypothetical protein